MKYKVMIVEDQTMPRELFELRIQASERFEVALSIDNAALADVYCLRFPVDLILMDVVTRGGESGLDAAERIKRMVFPFMEWKRSPWTAWRPVESWDGRRFFRPP